MITCEEHFPLWHTARIILNEWVMGMDGWDVSFDTSQHKANIVPRNRANITPEIFPPEDYDKVMELCAPVVAQYFPNDELLKLLMGPTMLPANQPSIGRIQGIMERHERDIIAMGGDTFQNAVAKALGIWPLRHKGVTL